MPLNKLDNFIKNTEGRILYVSPADLDSTDSIDNTGNSLARPFKTIQRALLESARFSYVKGTSNDLTERTTILLMPGDHEVDNRPGFKIYKDGIVARVAEPGFTTENPVAPSGKPTAQSVLDLSLETSFDLSREDNILYKFNSTEGGVIVPRGTSIVGLDLRKTKIKPLYVPNPTASYEDTPASAIFRITGACYFWQFSFFDGDENGLVYTDPTDFTDNNRSRPLFSHHKLTCFEYADGVNNVPIGAFDTELTDLDMYYAKLSNAYGTASGSPDRDIDDKFPTKPDGFAKQRPEWEIVGAFAADPITISTISAGSGGVPDNTVTVTTATNHNLTEGTPIKIRGVIPNDYNISAKVATVDPTDPRTFTYQLPTFRTNLETLSSVNSSGAEVVIETDTVTGASPYIFNISLRSVYGMNGMQADGAKADGFRSMVVAQFTGVSLQKDDRAFVKYNKSGRDYNGIDYIKVTGSDLAAGSASTNTDQVYHLDSQAIYRSGWEQTHIRIRNDAILQIVSVFAIGYNKHFNCESGADASITNSNSNFGQLSLISDGFKKDAFAKDNKAFITNIFTPKSIETTEEEIDWLNIDVATTISEGDNTRLYIAGFQSEDNIPPVLTQGYRIGAKVEDELFVRINSVETSARIVFVDGNLPSLTPNSYTQYSSSRELSVQSVTDTKLDFGQTPKLSTGEKVILISNSGEYPENIVPHQVYYVIALDPDTLPNSHRIALASTKTDAENGNAIKIYGGSDLKIISRVTDKLPGEPGHPIQWNDSVNRWYIQTSNSTFYEALDAAGGASAFESGETEPTFIRRRPDPRSLDEKVFKLRVVVPKELKNGKTPESGFIIQESSSTNVRENEDFDPANFTQNDAIRQQKITLDDYDFNRNPRFISTCTFDGTTSVATIVTEVPHNMRVGEKVVIRNVSDFANTSGDFNKGYNGTFSVVGINTNNMEFSVANDNVPAPGDNFTDKSSTNNVNTRTIDLPRYDRNDLTSNFYIYRNETVTPYIEDQQDGVYHIYALRSDIGITTEFTDLKYSQNVTDLYPQLDRDNVNDSPQSAKSYALRSPIGEVHTSDLKESITRDTANEFITKLASDLIIENSSVVSTGITEIGFTRAHNFSGLISGTVGGTQGTYASGTYHNVRILDGNNASSSNWRGAAATITVTGSTFTSSDVVITSRGSGYSSGETLYLDTTVMGDVGNLTVTFTPGSDDTINSTNDYVQVTGISTLSDQYYRINSVSSAYSIQVHNPATFTNIIPGQTVIHAGRTIAVTSYSAGTVTCSSPHGLVKGNRFRFLDSDDNSIGDFIVSAKTSPTVFTIDTSKGEPSATPAYALKHYMSANDEVSDASQESIAARGNTFYGGDSIELLEDLSVFMSSPNETIPETKVKVTNIGQSAANSGDGDQTHILERFPIGSYIQIEDEIMRVARTDLLNDNEMIVIRGALATEIQEHIAGSLIKKINPLPVEFRRPSIIRASGHTFEYLGYGPGNYSTGLPQVQDRTLTEREEFLTQAQERSAGIVVYTGMNNKGDFYIGNTKKSSATGEETSFDTPIPTITGEDAARLSAIFDEVTVKERIVVEGGDSGLILSQFDGPVTFNKEIRVKNNLNVSGILKIKNETNSTSPTTGSVQINGGVGIAKDVNIGGNLIFPDEKKLRFGTDPSLPDDKNHQLEIYASTYNDGESGSQSYGANIIGCASTDRALRIQTDGAFVLEGTDGGKKLIRAINPAWNQTPSYGTKGSVELYWDDGTTSANTEDDVRLKTTETGVYINGELQVTDDITAFYTSDSNLKTNIKPIDDPLEKVLSLHGYTFDWNEESGKQGSETGVIAQEVEALGLPGLVTTRSNGYLAVNYEKLVPVLLGSIRDLKFMLDKQNEKIKVLTTRINGAETGIESIEEKLSDK